MSEILTQNRGAASASSLDMGPLQVCRGPNYHTYPLSICFEENPKTLELFLKSPAQAVDTSIHLHNPFSARPSLFYLEYAIAGASTSVIGTYWHYLKKDIEQRLSTSHGLPLQRLEFSGPDLLAVGEEGFVQLLDLIRKWCDIDGVTEPEYILELPVENLHPASLRFAREAGFNILRLGVHDFHPMVQSAIGNYLSLEQAQETLAASPEASALRLWLGLTIGLPFQTASRFSETLDAAVRLQPARISINNYSHVSTRNNYLKSPLASLPNLNEQFELHQLAHDVLTRLGYRALGPGQYAHPDSAFYQAKRAGRLRRCPRGYTTRPVDQEIGLGLSTIGMSGLGYTQNHTVPERYYRDLEAGKAPFWRCHRLTEDDRIRRAIIAQLLCDDIIDVATIEADFHVDFWQYFAFEAERLRIWSDCGQIDLSTERIALKPESPFIERPICQLFDRRLRRPD